MPMRWMRKVLVLALAALGVQYLMTIARAARNDLRPRPTQLERATAQVTAARRARKQCSRLAPERLVITTLEPHGAFR